MRVIGHERRRKARIRIAAALAVAILVAGGVYALIAATHPDNGFVGFVFLLVLPAALSAFVARVADPLGEREFGFYMRVPLYLLAGVIVVSIGVLREGTVCILMLSPIWLALGCAGSAIAFRLRPRGQTEIEGLYETFRGSSALLILPVLLIQVEAALPVPQQFASVTRQVVIDAPPSRVWPLLRGIPDVRPDEGRWTLSQDVIGIARPVGATLVGDGIGAVRRVRWQSAIDFEERIVAWQAGRLIRWSFVFDRASMNRFGDRHLLPDGSYIRITDGGYRLDQLDGGRTRVTLDTRYWMRTPVNRYAALWGELVLGDLETNVLAIIKDRAERL